MRCTSLSGVRACVFFCFWAPANVESVFRLKDMDKGKTRLWMDVRLDRGQVKKTEEDSDSVKCHCTGG